MQKTFLRFTVSVAAIMTLTAGAALAGFEYVPAPSAAPQGAAPQTNTNDGMLTPIPAPVEPVAAQPLQTSPAAQILAVPAPAAPVTPAPVASAPQAPLLKIKTIQPAAPILTPPPVTAATVNTTEEIIPAPTDLTPPTAAQTQVRMDTMQATIAPPAIAPAAMPEPAPVAAAEKPMVPVAEKLPAREPAPQIIWNPAPAKKVEAPKAPEAEQEPLIQKIESNSEEMNVDLHEKSDKWANQLNADTGETTLTPRTREPVALPQTIEAKTTEAKAADKIFETKAASSANERRPEGLVIPPEAKQADVKLAKPIEIKTVEPVQSEPLKPEPVKTVATAAAKEIKTDAPKKLVINPFPQGGAAAKKIANATEAGAGTIKPAADGSFEIAVANNNAGEFTNVVGFGSNMPLALALQQIAPPQFTFSFGPGVNAGTSVSWDGANKPWDQVVADTIAPLNLKARIDGNIVHITSDAVPAEKHASLEQRPGEPVPLKDEEAIHRDNIVDPGERSKAQPLSTLASMEKSAAAEQATDSIASKAEPSLPAEQKTSAIIKQENILAGTVPGVRGTWAVRQGDSLKETLDAWSKKANMALVWNATHDYTVDADITVNDTFQSAVQMVVAQGVKADKPAFKIEGDTLIVQDKT